MSPMQLSSNEKKKKSIAVVLIFKIACKVNGVCDKEKELKESKNRLIVYVNIYLLVFF